MRVAGALGVLCAVVACNTATTESPPGDASISNGDVVSQTGDAQSLMIVENDGALRGASDAATYRSIPDATSKPGDLGLGLDATDLDSAGPDPAPLACDADAGSEAGLCPPPHSACTDTSWLVYYDNGQCVSGQCVWEKRYTECGGLYCVQGACMAPITQ